MFREKQKFPVVASMVMLPVLLYGCQAANLYAQGKGNGNGGGSGGTLSYQIVQLPTFDNSGKTLAGTARDVNASQFAVGEILSENGGMTSTHAVCWTATTTNSGTFESEMFFLEQGAFGQSQALGCNDWGEIVGTVGDEHAVLWQNPNALPDLLPGPFILSTAYAINEQSVICGRATDDSGAHAVVWLFINGQWKDFVLPPQGDPGSGDDGLPLPNISLASDISDEDVDTGLITIAGQSNGNSVTWTLFIGDDGDIVVLGSQILDADSEGISINNSETVCGWTQLGPSAGGDGVAWSADGTATLLPQLYKGKPARPVQSWPSDISDDGLIVGSAALEAIVWHTQNTSPVPLNDFLPKKNSDSFSSLTQANAVNAFGDIVGQGTFGEQGLLVPYLAIRSQD